MKRIVTAVLAVLMLAAVLCGCQAGKKTKLVILDTEYAVEDYAICISKDREDLLNDIDGALSALIADGTVQKVIDHYISGAAKDYTFQQNVAADAPELIMATNAAFPPYEFYENNAIVGIDADIAAAIADELGMKLNIVDTEFGSIIGGVQTGKYHIGMAGMTVTDERKQNVNFSTTYATGIQSVIVKEGSAIKSVDDLYAEGAAYVVGVQQDTTGDIYATDDFGESRVIKYSKGADAVQALLTGKVDCVIIDNEPAKSFVATNNK